MQARWGTHGDHPAIVLAASNVADMYRLTMAAVRFAQRFRTPVILLADEVVGHMRESFSPELVGRYRLTSGDFDFTPGYSIPILCARCIPRTCWARRSHPHVTGLIHDETGFPTNDPRRARSSCASSTTRWPTTGTSCACTTSRTRARAGCASSPTGRAPAAPGRPGSWPRRKGLQVEVLHLYTLFPLPVEIIQTVARRVEFMLIPELNLGQYAREVRKMAENWTTVISMGKIDGTLITPREILDRVTELVGKYESVC